MGAIGSFINPPEIQVGTAAPVSSFKAQQPVEQDWQKLINAALAQQAGVTAGQNALAGSLQAQANGTGGPNLAQQQLQNATNQNIQQQAGAVASLRGLNPAVAQRLIAMQGAQIQQQAAGQSAEARMQQQLAAQGQLGQLYGQQQTGNMQALGTGAQAFGQQNATALGAQGLDQATAAGNAANTLGAQKANLGLTDMGAQTTGGLVNAAGALGAAALASHGAVVPGTPRVAGDSPMNDTKPYMLSPGEVVVPKSIADDPEATEAFIATIRRHKAKHGKGQ